MDLRTITSTLLIFLIAVALSTVTLAQDSNFEGQVKINGEQNGSEYEIVYFMKGDKMRVEYEQPQVMALIMDDEDMTILMPEEKHFMTFSKDDIEQMQQMMGSDQSVGTAEIIEKDMEMQKSGQTKEILGKECELWVYEDENEKVEIWVTSGFNNFMGFSSPLEEDTANAWKELFDGSDVYPMEMTRSDKDGNETYSFKITEMKEKSLSDDLFTPPSDYEEMNMMGRNM